GALSALSDLAKTRNAAAIIHCGNFGFYGANFMDFSRNRNLASIVRHSALVTGQRRQRLLELDEASFREDLKREPVSELVDFLEGRKIFSVPIYVTYGRYEDVHVLDKFTNGTYMIPNLHIIYDSNSMSLNLSPSLAPLRLLGLGGALVSNSLFDHAEADCSQAGGDGEMWASMLQVGQVVREAKETMESGEIRVLVASVCPAVEALVGQLALCVQVRWRACARGLGRLLFGFLGSPL
ncbi:hypothetical protein BDK51DRAFT_23033, partial [Blyttiomyces helicus]